MSDDGPPPNLLLASRPDAGVVHGHGPSSRQAGGVGDLRGGCRSGREDHERVGVGYYPITYGRGCIWVTRESESTVSCAVTWQFRAALRITGRLRRWRSRR